MTLFDYITMLLVSFILTMCSATYGNMVGMISGLVAMFIIVGTFPFQDFSKKEGDESNDVSSTDTSYKSLL